MNLQKRILKAVEKNKDELLAFVIDMANIPSPTGEEKEVAEFYGAKMEKIGLEVEFQEVESDRPNVIGICRGEGGGLDLMFNGHFDTSITGKEEMLGLTALGREKYSLEELRAFLAEKAEISRPLTKTPARVEEDHIVGGIGGGITNMKASDASYVMATKAVMDCGVKLKGDVIIAGVVGEIEKAPIDRYEGKNYRGGGFGTRYLLSHGYTADMGIDGEPTGFKPQCAFPGTIFIKITVKGTPTHTATSKPGINAIKKAYKVIEAVEKWDVNRKSRFNHEMVQPNVSVGAIEGGWPYKPTYSAPFCHLYLDVRTFPWRKPLEVKREFQILLDDLKAEDTEFEAEMQLYFAESGYELRRDHQIMKVATNAHKVVFGSTPEKGLALSARTDAIIMNQYGIPTINYGLGKRYETYARKFDAAHSVRIEDLVNLCKVFALSIADICTRSSEDDGTGHEQGNDPHDQN